MKRRELSRKIAARRKLHAIAHQAAPFFARERLERVLHERAPDLVRLCGDREVQALVELVKGPFGA